MRKFRFLDLHCWNALDRRIPRCGWSFVRKFVLSRLCSVFNVYWGKREETVWPLTNPTHHWNNTPPFSVTFIHILVVGLTIPTTKPTLSPSAWNDTWRWLSPFSHLPKTLLISMEIIHIALLTYLSKREKITYILQILYFPYLIIFPYHLFRNC